MDNTFHYLGQPACLTYRSSFRPLCRSPGSSPIPCLLPHSPTCLPPTILLLPNDFGKEGRRGCGCPAVWCTFLPAQLQVLGPTTHNPCQTKMDALPCWFLPILYSSLPSACYHRSSPFLLLTFKTAFCMPCMPVLVSAFYY